MDTLFGRALTTRGNNYLCPMLVFQVDYQYFAFMFCTCSMGLKNPDAKADNQRSGLVLQD
ncbi:hypothetical protein OKW28_008487 [Paraburkholderia sp. 40]